MLNRLIFVEESPVLVGTSIKMLKAISDGLDEYKIEIGEDGKLGLERARQIADLLLEYVKAALDVATMRDLF